MRTFIYALIGIFLFFAAPLTGHAESDKIGFNLKEIEDEFKAGKNFKSFNRISGLLTDLLREQKRAYIALHGDKMNQARINVENLINEASYYESQKMREESFQTLHKAYEELLASLKQLNNL